jgi:hypothetical protein
MEGVMSVVLPVGAQAGTINKPLWRVPSAHGGVTLLNAWIISAAAATTIFQLSNMGTALGTAISSNIGTLNGTLVANTQKAISITTAYQAAASWIALSTLAGDTLNADSKVVLEYKFGK